MAMPTKRPEVAEILPPLLAGLLMSVYMQTVTGWWLNSGRGVAYTDGALLALAALFGSIGAGPPLVVRLVALWTGAQVSLTAYLFLHEGGSTIFPIVILGGAILSAAAVAAGGGLGWLVGLFVTRRNG
jgi:hypothetical protein